MNDFNEVIRHEIFTLSRTLLGKALTSEGIDEVFDIIFEKFSLVDGLSNKNIIEAIYYYMEN